MHYDVIIAGAGPGGLSCASKLAQFGINTLVIEKKAEAGPKVCAGGITWSGLLKTVPEQLIERSFPRQNIRSRFQSCVIEEPNPIIATINRKNLGHHMVEVAKQHGATIMTSTSLVSINNNTVSLLHHNGKKVIITFDYLVGADGSSSKVRQHLGLSSKKAGIGINYDIDGYYEKMEWHLNDRFFKNGYGWIFPHKDTISIGAYVGHGNLTALALKRGLLTWAEQKGFHLKEKKCTAGLINYDYQGWQFDNIFLVGDAAGFASALTGEGIYPAIISGEAAAKKILAPSCNLENIEKLEKKQKIFTKMVELTSRNCLLSLLLSELGILGLRTKIFNFTMLEMGQ